MKKNGGAFEADGLAAIAAEQREAARAWILVGELDEATIHLAHAERVERLARLVDARPRARPPVPVQGIVLLGACVVLVSAGWKLKLATFVELEVSIHGETTAAELTLARPTTLAPFRGEAVELGRLSSLTAQISEVPPSVTGDGWARVIGPPVVVRGLRAAGGSRLALAWVTAADGAPSLGLRAYARGIEGELLVRPGALVSAGAGDTNQQSAVAAAAGGGGRLTGDVLDVIAFGCADCADAPFRLDVRGSQPFTFGNVQVSQLAFAIEQAQPDGTMDFTSGLRGGSIRLLDVGRTETIETGDNLRVNVVRTRRFQIGRAAKEDALSFVYEGTVKRIALGPRDVERDLSPSVVEYFYRQKAMALLWGAAAFLWGLFKGIQSLWKGKSS